MSKCTQPIWLGEQPLPCGKCFNCQMIYKYEWANRLECELETAKTGVFLTLTYNEEHIDTLRDVSKETVQKFIMRFRQELRYYQKTKISYYAIGDYGDQYGRPHYHLAVFGVGKRSPIFKYSDFNAGHAELNSWKNGYVHVQVLTLGRIKYVTAYLMKKYTPTGKLKMYGGRQQPFSLMSKGLGKSYVQTYQEELTKNMSITRSGVQRQLPRYYRKLLEIKDESISERLQTLTDLKVLGERAMLISGITGIDNYYTREGELRSYRFKQNQQWERNTKGRMALK